MSLRRADSGDWSHMPDDVWYVLYNDATGEESTHSTLGAALYASRHDVEDGEHWVIHEMICGSVARWITDGTGPALFAADGPSGRRGGFLPMNEPTPDVATVMDFINCINRGDVDGIDALISDRHTLQVFNDAPQFDRYTVIEAWREHLSRFPSYQIHPEAYSVDNAVAVLGHTTGFYPPGANQFDRVIPIIWVAQVRSRRLSLWRLFNDTPAYRRVFGFAVNPRRDPRSAIDRRQVVERG